MFHLSFPIFLRARPELVEGFERTSFNPTSPRLRWAGKFRSWVFTAEPVEVSGRAPYLSNYLYCYISCPLPPNNSTIFSFLNLTTTINNVTFVRTYIRKNIPFF